MRLMTAMGRKQTLAQQHGCYTTVSEAPDTRSLSSFGTLECADGEGGSGQLGALKRQ